MVGVGEGERARRDAGHAGSLPPYLRLVAYLLIADVNVRQRQLLRAVLARGHCLGPWYGVIWECTTRSRWASKPLRVGYYIHHYPLPPPIPPTPFTSSSDESTISTASFTDLPFGVGTGVARRRCRLDAAPAEDTMVPVLQSDGGCVTADRDARLDEEEDEDDA